MSPIDVLAVSASLSARRAWIEIHLIPSNGTLRNVALRKESVDRNGQSTRNILTLTVALRKESVDRNPSLSLPSRAVWMSLSARRAWIEIQRSV